MEEGKTSYTIIIDRVLWAKVKNIAYAREITLNQAIIEALEDWIND
jgi:hypothetical protein